MRIVARKRRRWKKKVTQKRKIAQDRLALAGIDDIDVQVELIQTLIPLGLEKVEKELQKEVEKLAGPWYKHGKENTRWTKQNGSVYLADQKVPMKVPRVRNKLTNREVPLETYQKLQRPYQGDEKVFKKLLNGLTMNRYAESAELVPEVFGLSPSNISRRFKQTTAAKLRSLQNRNLDKHDFVVIFIDGKRFAEEGIVIAVGITSDGKKVILGLEQMSTENHRAVEQFFDKLIERGLRFEEGLLFVVDGSKGLIKAIRNKFQGYALIQRCQWHKRENVVSYLNRADQAIWRRKLQGRYGKEDFVEALAGLKKLGEELEKINPSAAASLNEGLEETLTINKLGLTRELKRNFSNTNGIESILAQVEQYTQRVDRWRNGTHIQRWVGASLLEVEPRLRKVHGYRHLKLLRTRIKEELGLNSTRAEQKLVEVRT